jgi:hypothetical protein
MTTTITTTVPSGDLQAPILLNESDMDAVAGGDDKPGPLQDAYRTGKEMGGDLDKATGLSDRLGDWFAGTSTGKWLYKHIFS